MSIYTSAVSANLSANPNDYSFLATQAKRSCLIIYITIKQPLTLTLNTL
ncbi:protein of unknown function [Shewanella benthica]|uniref:Uncharacterized protein n=1 Tax=Shewanella benthica TaxID=43661 RepID=A0A330M8W2_9GAMM|nr:protein of unknown function [Shewanella benthica]